jgi:capsular polysaccharide biosynthesis protein
VRAGGRSSILQLAQLQQVLYLPHVLGPSQSICIAQGHAVPLESVLDARTVDFLKQRKGLNPRSRAKYANGFEVDEIAGEVCVLGNLFSRNFGHWTEELLKVSILEDAKRGCRYVIPTMPVFARSFLEFLGVPEERILIVDGPAVFERAVFTTAISHENIDQYPAALFLLRELVHSRLGGGESPHAPRLWLERGTGVQNTGITSNKEEVYACLRPYGFEILDMAALSIADQMIAARDAAMMAGPHGAQFVHVQFMKPASRVIECFSPMHVNPSVLQICRALRHSYHQVVSRSHVIAPYSRARDCEVDCEHLQLVLEQVYGRP